MRVLLAPNAFRGGPSARWVADALASGLQQSAGVTDVVTMPLSDGGDGALAVAEELTAGQRVRVPVTDPLGHRHVAEYLRTGPVAFVETALAAGLELVSDRRPQPLVANTAGVGQLIVHAVSSGARRIIVAAGGMASVDLGAGALAELGVRFFNGDGKPLCARPRDLVYVRQIDATRARALLAHVAVEALSDVWTPLGGNIARFGAQKGITASDAVLLEQMISRFLAASGHLDSTLLKRPLLGAGGGLAAGLHTVLGAPVRHGGDYFATRAGLRSCIERADLVITAEGRLDHGSLDGKLPALVAWTAAALGKPTVIVAGQITISERDLPAGVRCVELGLPPPPRGGAETPERWNALARAAQSAVEIQEPSRGS